MKIDLPASLTAEYSSGRLAATEPYRFEPDSAYVELRFGYEVVATLPAPSYDTHYDTASDEATELDLAEQVAGEFLRKVFSSFL